MQTYLSNIIPSLRKYSKKLDNSVFLSEKYWIVIDETSKNKTSYYFRENRDVLININGTVKKGRWDYISNDSILIEVSDEIHIFRHGFLDDNIFVLRLDNTDKYIYLVSEKFIGKALNTIEAIDEFLKGQYLNAPKSVEGETAISQDGTLNVVSNNTSILVEEDNEKEVPVYLMVIGIFLLCCCVVAIIYEIVSH